VVECTCRDRPGTRDASIDVSVLMLHPDSTDVRRGMLFVSHLSDIHLHFDIAGETKVISRHYLNICVRVSFTML
jgi:hypothetical protein